MDNPGMVAGFRAAVMKKRGIFRLCHPAGFFVTFPVFPRLFGWPLDGHLAGAMLASYVLTASMTPIEANIDRCRQGDLSCFGPLYEAFVRRVYDFVWYRTMDRQLAEDVTSDVFTKALGKVRAFAGATEGEFAAWIFSIARNAVTDQWRKKPRETVDVESVAATLGHDEKFGEAEDRRQALKSALEWLGKLPRDQRDIVMMRVWDDLPYSQIAAVTGKSEDSCKQVVSRALRAVQANVPLALIFALFLTVP